MIVNQCKKVSKIRQFVRFRCNKLYSTPGTWMSETGLKGRGNVKTNYSKWELKKHENVMDKTNSSNVSSKVESTEKKTVGVANTVIHIKETEKAIKEEISQREPETIKKEGDLVLDDFLIRNIMTFPLHVTVDKTDNVNHIEPKIKRFPSVTSILNETMATDARKRLELWKQKMIEMMGPEKFLAYNNDPVQKLKAKKLSLKRKRSKKIVVATLNRGTRLHSALKSYLLGEDMEKIPIHKEVEGCWESVKTILPHISDVKVVEADIFHPHLHYKGVVDCVASYKNTPYVIEWKQSEKVKKDLSATFDAPVQLTAYMGALSWCKKAELTAPVTCGLVVVAYCDGAPADVFQMNSDFCHSYWEQWLRRVQRFWATRSQNLQASTC